MAERILFDVNVLLDALLRRRPHAHVAERLWAMVEAREVKGYVPAHGVTTIFYLVRKQVGADEARTIIGLILHVFRVAPVTQKVIASALGLGCPDFEDAVCAAAAAVARCTMIVSRDPKGFVGSLVRVVEPEVAVATLVRRATTR